MASKPPSKEVGQSNLPYRDCGLLALAPALFVRHPVAIPGAAVFVLLLQRHLVERTVRAVLLVGGLPRALDTEPCAGLLNLRLDAGEVRPPQRHHNILAVEGGFQGDADGCLWQGTCCRWQGCCKYRLSLGLLRWWLAGAIADTVKLCQLLLGQHSGPLLNASRDSMLAPVAGSFGIVLT